MSAPALRPLRPKEGLVAWATRMLAEGKAKSLQARGVDQAGHPMARNIVTANFAPRCTSPREFGGDATTSPGNRLEVRMKAKCRRCDECLADRKAMWALRAIHENKLAPKSLFATLTVAPDTWVIVDARARNRAWKSDPDTGELTHCWDEWTPHQQSWAFFLELGKEVTKYLKRYRKSVQDYCRIRFSMYNEKGDEFDREHVHLLLHVHPIAPYGVYEPVPWDVIWWHAVRAWKRYEIAPGVPLGIATAEWVRHPEKGAWYVAGYLEDSSHNRARASLRYGPPRVRPLAGKPPQAGSSGPVGKVSSEGIPDGA